MAAANGTAPEGGDDRAWRFSRAIVRAPAATATAGLRAVDTGAPDIERMRADHAAYVAALEDAGLAVTALPPLPAYPDAQFVEDTALCLPEGAVVLRPGAPSRLGEAAEIAPALAAIYGPGRVLGLAGPGHVEGGDLLLAGTEILAGLSARTDADGLDELAARIAPWGYRLRVLATPPGVLHFKTDCALIGPGTILATRRLAATGAFAGFRLVEVPEGEEAGANAIRVNDRVLMAAGFPRTAAAVAAATGARVISLRNDEFARLDGGMSCLSLRMAPRP